MKLIQAQHWFFSTGLVFLAVLGAREALVGGHVSDELGYRSVAERTLEKHFVQHSEMSLVSMKMTLEGPDGPEEQELENPSLRSVDDETIEFSDETLSAGEGRPKKLKRSFTRIENSIAWESDDEDAEDQTITNESGLAGKSVLFTWNSEDEKFDASWFEDKGDDALLEPMVEDADFRGWLPGKEVDEDDTWTIEPKEFNNLQEPSGPMGYRPADAEEGAEEDEADDERPEMKGEFKATYKGTRDEDGVKVGVIAFEGKLASQSEREIDAGEGGSAKETTEFSTELEGELLWNLAGGHFHSLSCDATQKLVGSMSSSIDLGETSISYKQERTLEGKKTYRFSCSSKKS